MTLLPVAVVAALYAACVPLLNFGPYIAVMPLYVYELSELRVPLFPLVAKPVSHGPPGRTAGHIAAQPIGTAQVVDVGSK